jgi:putative FmdB family regulatory protein
MPVYEFRCNSCQRPLSLFYKTYQQYDSALQNGVTCPHCGSTHVTRLISRVAIAKQSVNFAGMSSGEMLNVLEGGDSREVGRMIQEVGGDQALNDPTLRNVSDRLLRGDSAERIERDIAPTPPTGV